MKYATGNNTFVPAATGQVINVTADDTELLQLMFGEHADEVAAILRKPRKGGQYVQVISPKMVEQAKTAVESLRLRQGEDVAAWAKRLADDTGGAND